jgi:hypothetical protein
MRNVRACFKLAMGALLALGACGGSVAGGPGSGGGGMDAGACTLGPERQCCTDADCTLNCGTCGDGVCSAPAFGCTEGTCHGCACLALMSQGGCADVCGGTVSSTTTPNFCQGVPALPQCAACLNTKCAAYGVEMDGGLGIDPNNPAACM